MTRFVHAPLARAIFAAAAIATLPAFARAQQQEFRLDDEGSWNPAAAPEPGSDQELIQRARIALAEGRPDRAYAIVDAFLERNERTANPFLPEAYLLRGDARTARGDEYKALYDYEEVIKNFPGTEQFTLAIERELDIGVRYLAGLRRKFLGLRIDNARSIGEELLMRVQERLPNSRLAERACIELADHYYRSRDLKMAAEVYAVFVTNYPESQYRQKAMQRLIYANIGRFKGPRYDASGLIEAEALIEDFSQTFPAEAENAGLNDALVARLDESAAAQMLDTARWYLRRDDPVSARLTLRRLIRRHPAAVAAVRAQEILDENGWTAQAPAAASPDQPVPEGPPEPDAEESSTPADSAPTPSNAEAPR